MGKTSSDKRDIYYRMAKEKGYRARSAFKLLECDEKHHIFDGVNTVVDLCAAPGSWSQVIAQKLGTFDEKPESTEEYFRLPNGSLVDAQGNEKLIQHRAIAVDLQDMSPIDGVHILKGDITEESTIKAIIRALGDQKAGLVVCDGAPDVTGSHSFDEYMQAQLLYSAISTTMSVLKPGGSFVSKIFRSGNIVLLRAQMLLLFEKVYCFKPFSSRSDSCEHFLICKNYKPIEGFKHSLKNPVLAKDYAAVLDSYDPIQRKYIPFFACGDLTGWDPLDKETQRLSHAVYANARHGRIEFAKDGKLDWPMLDAAYYLWTWSGNVPGEFTHEKAIEAMAKLCVNETEKTEIPHDKFHRILQESRREEVQELLTFFGFKSNIVNG